MSRSLNTPTTTTASNGTSPWSAFTTDLRKRACVAAMTLTAGVGAFLGSGAATIATAMAQGGPAAAILINGNAVLTGFSGARAADASGGASSGVADAMGIDLDGRSARVIDLQAPGAPPKAQLLDAPKPFTATAAEIGQVFAVTLDNASPPNIYLAATSAYGLPIVVPGPDGSAVRARRGAPDARFMAGLFGPSGQGGGPGSIWRIDGVSGSVRRFANVALDGVPNSGPALGGLAFDPASGSIFAADRQTGMIHRFDLSGAERGRFNHGTQGRTSAGLMAVPYDPADRLDITSPAFDTENPATWGYASVERRVFGLAVHAGRLYYAVADGLQVWSVAIAPDGAFGGDARIEVQVPPWDGESEISKIAFDDQGRMLLAERAAPTGAYDFEELAKAAAGRVLRYRSAPARLTSTAAPQSTGGSVLWQPQPDEYAIGFAASMRNGNGGLAIGYDYTPDGRIDRRTCGGFLWSSGEQLRVTADPALAARLAASGPANVDGLQGNALSLVRPANVPPLQTYFVDYDDRFDDAAARGHLGDVAIWRMCGAAEAAAIGGDVLADDAGEFIGEPGWPVCRDDLRRVDFQNGAFRRERHCCPREYFHQGRCWRFPPLCPPRQHRAQNGKCEPPNQGCPPNQTRQDNGKCEPPNQGCPPNQTRVDNGQCVPPNQGCPSNTIQLSNGKCVTIHRYDPTPTPPRHLIKVETPRQSRTSVVIVQKPSTPRAAAFVPNRTRHAFAASPVGGLGKGLGGVGRGVGGMGHAFGGIGKGFGGMGGGFGGRMAVGGMGFGMHR